MCHYYSMINNKKYLNSLLCLNRFISNLLSGLVCIPENPIANPEKTNPRKYRQKPVENNCRIDNHAQLAESSTTMIRRKP